MDISYNKAKKIFDTLPIGYYLGNKIEAVLDENCKNTFFDTSTYNITISFPMIQQALQHITEEKDIEVIIRGLLYHELGHAILAPPNLLVGVEQYEKDIINIFEDCRIELILKDFYMNTNFEKNLHILAKDLFNKKDNENLSPMEKYYLAVRFNIGTQKQINDKIKLLNNYKNVTSEYLSISYYTYNILSYYYKYFASEKERAESVIYTYLSTDEESEKAEIKNIDNMPTVSKEQAKKLIKLSMQSMVTSILNNPHIKQIYSIFEHLKNKQSFRGQANCAYSGIIQPKLCDRKDCRFFLRPFTKGAEKGFDKLHLNLFIDVSGSFEENENMVNGLLYALKQIEKENDCFSFDLVTINTKATLMDKNKRYIKCDGNNDLPMNLKDIFHQITKSDAINYNLILFDGDCLSGVLYERDEKEHLKNFITTFDYNNTTIISDLGNKTYFKGFKNAKVIWCRDYVDKLMNNIIIVLQTMFLQ